MNNTERKLIDMVKPEIHLNQRGGGTPAELQVLVALHCWGRREIQDDATDLHGLTQPTVSRAFARFGKKKIKMPQNLMEEQIVMRNFKSIKNFPGVIGAIDGTHIKIKKTGGDLAQYYTNRKGYYSLNIQVICDAKLIIRDVVARWRGSTHHSTSMNLPLSSDSKIVNLEDAYWIATRNPVERCFGVWKQRFPCLLDGLTISLSNAKTLIVALAVLHNIAIEENDPLPCNKF
ncbi:putative nuclease HARBI1 [Lucilia cuprina]|nr:putative nuclease HARBI1 [Lucilia cuprina]